MEWLVYLAIFAVICVVWFFITRIWVGGIDLLMDGFKKIFGINKNNHQRDWHSLEEIRNANKKDNDELN